MASIRVVDDNPALSEMLSELLRTANHEVITAGDGLEARAKAARHQFQLMITDISMPNEEGLGMILAMRKAHPELKIIVISGSDPEILMDAKILGAYAALRKPVTSEIVLQCVRGM